MTLRYQNPPTDPDDPATPGAPRPGPLGRLGGFAFRRRRWMVLAWVFAIALAIGLSAAFGGDSVNDNSTPGSDSEQAQHLLEDKYPARAGATVDVVVRADDVTSADVRGDVSALIATLSDLPDVADVEDPYSIDGAIAPDGQTLVAQAYLEVPNANGMPVESTERMLEAAEAAERDGLEIALGGQAIQLAQESEAGSEMMGIAAAAVILLITFGSLVAAGLPLIMAIAGIAVSSSLVGLVAAVMDTPDYASIIGMMLGIALGIDYALLMVTRFREWRAAGLDPETATVATLDTAGRAVFVAGGTVIVSMTGLFATGLSAMYGTAVVAMVAVLVVLVAAITLFPALLGYLGPRIDKLRLPIGRRRTAPVSANGHVEPTTGWARWGRAVKRRRGLVTTGVVALLLAMAVPFLDVRFGFPDAGNDPEGTSSRQAYDMLSDGFGPGRNAPLLVVADISGADNAAVDGLGADLAAVDGVAHVTPPNLNAAGDTATFTVVPTTGAQDAATDALAHTLRDDVIPAATEGTGAEVYVGGRTAAVIDVNEFFADRIPVVIGGVVVVSMLLLVLAFRSIVIALTAAVMNLLSVVAAYGVVAYFLQGGWAGQLIGIDTPTPMAAFIPVIMFTLLFALSMDYEIFLISRVRESWVRTRDNGRSIVTGLASTGRVITAAAAIMIVVFAAFVASDQVFVKVVGLGLAVAILVDATVVRMLLVPAVMHVLGRRNWWLPDGLDRRMPQLYIEGRPEVFLSRESDTRQTVAAASSTN